MKVSYFYIFVLLIAAVSGCSTPSKKSKDSSMIYLLKDGYKKEGYKVPKKVFSNWDIACVNKLRSEKLAKALTKDGYKNVTYHNFRRFTPSDARRLQVFDNEFIEKLENRKSRHYSQYKAKVMLNIWFVQIENLLIPLNEKGFKESRKIFEEYSEQYNCGSVASGGVVK